MVFLKEFFEKVDFEKNQHMAKKAWTISQGGKKLNDWHKVHVRLDQNQGLICCSQHFSQMEKKWSQMKLTLAKVLTRE